MNHFEKVSKNEKIQKLEGEINDLADFESGGWSKILPEGITLGDVDLFIKKEGENNKWFWHLKPKFIEDEKEREKWIQEKLIWGNL